MICFPSHGAEAERRVVPLGTGLSGWVVGLDSFRYSVIDFLGNRPQVTYSLYVPVARL